MLRLYALLPRVLQQLLLGWGLAIRRLLLLLLLLLLQPLLLIQLMQRRSRLRRMLEPRPSVPANGSLDPNSALPG